jgi:tRNA dimethylallyltransferase
VLPDRAILAGRIEQRLRQMVERDALDEVRALMALGLNPALPAMKAIGVPELAAHVRGEIDLDTALILAGNSTRQYAKRQYTWFKNQCGPEWQRL